MLFGLRNIFPGLVMTCSLKPPKPIIATTSSPTFQSVTLSPVALMTPEISPPGENGSGGLT